MSRCISISIEVHITFTNSNSGYMPNSRITRPEDIPMFICLELSVLFSIKASPVYIPSNSVPEFLYLYILTYTFCFLFYWYRSFSLIWDGTSFNSFLFFLSLWLYWITRLQGPMVYHTHHQSFGYYSPKKNHHSSQNLRHRQLIYFCFVSILVLSSLFHFLRFHMWVKLFNTCLSHLHLLC